MKIVKLTPERLAEELTELERAYSMSSAEFYGRYQAGELGDSEEVMYWAGLCATALQRGGLSSQLARA